MIESSLRENGFGEVVDNGRLSRVLVLADSFGFHLATVDLNLLVGFEALLAEGSVSRAGRRIGLAQSSMSNVLSNMRDRCNST